MIRPATLADVQAIFDMAMLETEMYSKLHPDKEKIRKGIIQSISSAKHFCWVGEHDGKVTGVLIGLVSPNLWAQRTNCFIALWKSNVVGDGIKLIRAFKNWMQDRRVIRVAGIVPDTDEISPRAMLLAEYLGFERCGGAHLYFN